MEFAIENIIQYGDTDIFPYPIERKIFRDKKTEIIELLLGIQKKFNHYTDEMPPEHEKLLSVVGYQGFRHGTHIDPIWNAYFLALVVSIGDDIEKSRLASEKNIVFSYRFKPDFSNNNIFDKNYGWYNFQKQSINLAQKYSHVLTCDISDFYPRIYHHRLENALKKATKKSNVINQIKYLLNSFSKGVSYGLPVGGPASRLLSELLLNRTDKLLITQGIKFCRFVDDYHIFGSSKEEIYGYLVYLSEILLNNEGLSLQKNKTRILTSAEFLATSAFVEDQTADDEEKIKHNFMQLHIHYDPYSDTADEDYDSLLQELNKFDIVSLLASEMQKTRISEGLTRKLVKAIAHINDRMKDSAILSLMDNLNILYPIYPTVMILLISIVNNLHSKTKKNVFEVLRNLIESNSHICKIPVNMAYTIRVLSFDNSEETDSIFINLFNKTDSMFIKKDIILTLAQHNADFWISDQIKRFNTATSWEKRSLIIASYILEDEGKEWRKRLKGIINDFDKIVLEWASEKKMSGDTIVIS